MGKITADYRLPISWIVCVFLLVWSIGFGGGGLYGLITKSQNATINDRQATPQEAMTMQITFTLIGLAVFVGAICLIVLTLRRRVEIEDNVVSSYSWNGKLQVQATLNQVQAVKMIKDNEGVKRYEVVTANGKFKFDSSMRNAFEFRDALEKHLAGPTEPISAPHIDLGGVLPLSPFIPRDRTFRYLFSYLHIFSFVWVGALIWMTSSVLSSPPNPESSPNYVMFLAMAVFLIPGIWMQMTGWIERIKLGPDGIQWIDWKGKTRAIATLEQIREINIVRGEASSMQIETDDGPVKASSYLWGFGNLRKDIERVIETRRSRPYKS